MDTVDRVFKLMEEKGVTAAEVSKGSSIPKSTITEWKKGRSKPSSEGIIKLSEYFDVSTDYLLGRSDRRHMTPTIAAHTDDPKGLPPEAQDEVLQYIEFIKQKYGIGKEDK